MEDKRANIGLFELVDMKYELQKILSRVVDLVEKQAIEKLSNSIRKRPILSSYEMVYE